MCFSANASFGTAAFLSVAGVICMRKSTGSSQLLFATIPFVFAAQQLAEGLVWRSFSSVELYTWRNVFGYTYLTFAHIVWPVVMPLSILLIEKNPRRKIALKGCLVVGILVALYLTWCHITYPVVISIELRHIFYDRQFPGSLRLVSGILYGAASLLPAFISSRRGVWVFGFLLTLSYLATSLIYQYAIISVWCFFAALLSVCIFFILRNMNEQESLAFIKNREIQQ